LRFKFHFFLLFFLLIAYALSSAADIILPQDVEKNYYLDSQFVDIFEDPENKMTIEEISSPAFQTKFKKLNTPFPENENLNSAYWIRYTVKSKIENPWILECYNQNANRIELYTPLGNGRYKVEKTGTDFHFEQRPLHHINFVFFLPDLSTEKTFYIKYISKFPIRARFLIHSYPHFTDYALNEYFFLGIFYGMIVFIGLYNLFLFPKLRDSAYLYYAIYVLFVGLYCMAQDGMGFQYLWPDFPQWNDSLLFFYTTCMVIFMLLYTKSFLETRNNLPKLNQIITVFIIIRIVIFIIDFLFLPELSQHVWIDLFAFLLAYFTAIKSYHKNNKSALYFVIGFSVLFFGFLINTLGIFKLIPANIFTVYALNISLLIEMILLSQALSERVKQIREKELIQENLNRELEEKVKERTNALMIQKNIIEEKVNTLDTFIYKASHDIKGPLKSLIGVAMLGLKDTKENAHIYFDHVLITANKLDAIVKDLLHITKINNTGIDLTEIDLKLTLHDSLEALKTIPGYDEVDFDIQINQEEKFYSEKTIIDSIFHNFIENAVKYRNQTAKNPSLKIYIKAAQGITELKFIDNGIGIPEEYHDKVFDMFFRTDYATQDSTGLGLYIVKLSVEKIGGQVFLQSKHGEGSTFTVVLKNSTP
jgi:two-component system, sensor histidine kinase LadS